jgi:hypothetical protein
MNDYKLITVLDTKYVKSVIKNKYGKNRKQNKL